MIKYYKFGFGFVTEIVNEDPYGEGWIIKIKLNEGADFSGLIKAEAYAAEVS